MIVRTKKKPSYKLISTYKTELMGVAAISVLIGHAGTAIIADTGAILLVPKMATLICTLMYMFFFLSGLDVFIQLNNLMTYINFIIIVLKSAVAIFGD